MVTGVRRVLLGGAVWALTSVGVLALSDAPASAFLGYGNRTSVFGAHVNLTTGENVCTAASGDECGPGEAGAGDGQFSLHPTPAAPGAGVAVDQTTHDVYVTDTENNRLEKFSATGAFLAAWGWGVADGEARFELCTTGCHAGLPGTGEGQLTLPVSVAVDNASDASAGDVYVADRGNSRIDKFSSTGALLGQFGRPAPEDPGSLEDPDNGLASELRGGDSVSVDPTTGNVWVADASNKRAVQYSPAGIYMAQINDPRISEAAFGLTVDANGDVYVLNGGVRVEEFGPAPSFAFIRNLDDGAAVSECCNPRAVVTNSAGEVFIGDRKSGYQIRQFGSGATETPPLHTFGESVAASTGIAIDPGTGTMYVADGPHQDVAVFALVQLATVGTGEPSNVKGTSTSVAGTIDPEGVEAHYYFEYNGVRSSEEATSEAKAVTANLEGLEPNTTYHYRLVAENANGTSRGQEREFTTGPVVAGVATTPASSVAITTAQFNGTLNPEGEEAHYSFEYGTSTEYTNDTEPQTTTAGALTSVGLPVEGLRPGTTYHYRIVASTEHGQTLGQDETVTTDPEVPTVDDQPPFATGVASHEATLHGTVNPGEGVTTYHFIYGPTAAYGSSTPDAYTQLNYEDDPVKQLVLGLAPGATYHYALVATNASGTATGPDQTVTTLSTLRAKSLGEEEEEAPLPIPANLAPASALPLLTTTVFPQERLSTPSGPSTRARKLAAALRRCVKQPHNRRASCRRRAMKRYGPARTRGK